MAMAIFCTMLIIQLMLTRSHDAQEVARNLNRIESRVGEIDDDVLNLEGRVNSVELEAPRQLQKEVDPLYAEVEVIGSLVKQMAEAMADMEEQIEDQGLSLEETRRRQMALPAQPQQQLGLSHSASSQGVEPSHLQSRSSVDSAQQPVQQPASQSAAYSAMLEMDADATLEDMALSNNNQSEFNMASDIRSAIDASRIDLYLQPIVSLPQRRVRYYEALTRLRTVDGRILEPIDFLSEAERIGQMPAIDNVLLFRSLQILKRLSSRNREAGLFCNLSPSTLVDDSFFPGFLEFIKANEAFSDLLIFEFTQANVAAMGLLEHESLAALAEFGFRFSIDHITDLRMDFKGLADKGFRFAKLNAARLLQQDETLTHGNIHPADFGSLLKRYGIELIPDHVEVESTVLELLDLDIRCAQGFLFSPPRPVRAEILQGAPSPRARTTA